MSMEKYYTPTEWENYPSEDTAINAMRLNHAEDGINELDDRIVELSTDKSEVDWNQILLSGEKIAEITINGIKKNVYTSNDSAKAEAQAYKAEGYATGEQNGIPVESGSPYYHNNSKYFSEQASDSASDASASAVEAGQSADDAEEEALVSEGWAVGEQNGEPVEPGSPYYHNNAKWYSEQSNVSDKLLMDKQDTLEPGLYYSDISLIPSGVVFPNDPSFTVYIDTKYEVITDIRWNATSRQLTVDLYNPLDTALTVKYKVYYKTV